MNKTLPTLYKIDSKGKQREFSVEYNEKLFTTYTGITGGKLTPNVTRPTPKGKNTIAEQVKKEAIAKHRKKFERELYSDDLSKPHPLQFVAPQAALDYTKVPHRAKWGETEYVTQPKLNGVRTICQLVNGKIKLTSRKGKQYFNTNIEEYLTSLYENSLVPNDIILDGELYIHGVELGDVTHAVAHKESDLEYRIFDVIDESTPFIKRYSFLLSITNLIKDTDLSVVPCTILKTEQELFDIHNQYTKDGYEGAMLRNTNAVYTPGKRTPGMFKYKHFQDGEFEIIGSESDKNGGAILNLITSTGIPFSSRPMGTDEYRKRLLGDASKLVGKFATVKYSTLLKTGCPEFGRVVSIRDYE